MTGVRAREPLQGFRMAMAVRFSECDLYGVVWHGRYAIYLEEIRNAACARHGWTVAAARERGYLVPVTRMETSFRSPARLDSTVTVTARLRSPEVARLVFDYQIRDPQGQLLTEAVTEQVVTRGDGELLLALPDGIRALVDDLLRDQDDPARREL
ncbi:MAG: acyl-CoA thioesterase [Thermoanaerobaculia bacterium]